MTNLLFQDIKLAKEYALAGKATLTAKSLKTGNHFTYKISVSKDNQKIKFVKVLIGENAYSYIGYIKNDLDFFYGIKSKISKDAPSVKAFESIFNHIKYCKSNSNLELYHHGRCGKCGRELTHPESIVSGLGPICSNIIH